MTLLANASLRVLNSSYLIHIVFRSLFIFFKCSLALVRFHFKDAVLEGGYPFEKANGVSIFKYREKDPRFGEAFISGMSEHSTFFMKQILNTYHGFEGLSSLVDVGGGNGAMLHLIISKYPSIKGGVNLDLADVIRHAQPYKGSRHILFNL